MARITAHAVDAKRTAGEELVGFSLHATLAILVGLLLAPLTSNGIVRLLSSLNVHHIPDFLAGVFGPGFWLCTVLTGFFMNHYVLHRSVVDWSDRHPVHSHRSCLGLRRCWTLGLLPKLTGGYRGDEFQQMCTSKCSASECLGLLVTIPSLSLISYSIGRRERDLTMPVDDL